MLIRWTPCQADVSGPAQPPDFWLAIRKSPPYLGSQDEQNPVVRRLAEIILAGLKEDDRRRLHAWHVASKLDLIQTTPISEIEIDDLPSADGGRMVGFVEVFPAIDVTLEFQRNGELWAADEQCCVQPQCPCTETALSFFMLKDAAGKPPPVIRKFPSLRYDYRSGATVPLKQPSGLPSPRELLTVLKREKPDLNLQLERRHHIMQCLYARLYLAQEQAQARIQTQARVPGASPSPKIGRNDPCPCGSGRKYKHCCLDKPRA